MIAWPAYNTGVATTSGFQAFTDTLINHAVSQLTATIVADALESPPPSHKRTALDRMAQAREARATMVKRALARSRRGA